MIRESPIIFACEGSRLIGLFCDVKSETGLLFIVGGPQYRAGSHRQYAALSRAVANAGYSTFRFDYRGMGDSEGEMLGFEQIEKDIDTALQQFLDTCKDLKRVVIYGLCDAASAAMMYAGKNSSQYGLIVLNPWLRTEKTQAQTILRHYYLTRLLSGDFWRKLLSANFNLFTSIKDIVANLQNAYGTRDEDTSKVNCVSQVQERTSPYPLRMQHAMTGYMAPVLVILSGEDLTAAEFIDTTTRDKNWSKIIKRENWLVKTLPQANHTLSNPNDKKQVENWIIDWIKDL